MRTSAAVYRIVTALAFAALIGLVSATAGRRYGRAAGIVGNTLYDLSRRPYTPPSYGSPRTQGARISLGGPRLDGGRQG